MWLVTNSLTHKLRKPQERKQVLLHGYCRENIKPILSVDIPNEIMDLCASYISFLESYIAENNNMINIEQVLYKLLLEKWKSKQEIKLKRIFCTEVDGNSSDKFHELCDDKEGVSTIVLIQSEIGNVFGGYSNTIWRKGGDCVKETPQQFLFLLYSMDQKVDTPQIFEHNEDTIDGFAVYHNPQYGPVFGLGHDIAISANEKGSTSRPYSYQIPNSSILAGSSPFTTSVYEVFQVLEQ